MAPLLHRSAIIRNEEIRRRTGMETMEVILRKIRLQWLGMYIE